MVRNKRSLLQSFSYAYQGFKEAFRLGKNLRIQVFIGICAVILAGSLGFSPLEWTILLLLIGVVISLELMNTALEKTLDVVDSNTNHTIKLAKDMAAAAVLFVALLSFIIGLILYLPKLIDILNRFF